jgi:hypothetical protein
MMAQNAAEKRQQAFRTTLGTSDAGKSAVRVAAVEVAFHHFLDDGTEEPVLLLETIFIFCKESIEAMK